VVEHQVIHRREEWPPAVTATDAPSPPRINVTIGRIEVRATAPAAAPTDRRRDRPAPQVLALEEYLQQREEGRSR
jgi:hypothetical protein